MCQSSSLQFKTKACPELEVNNLLKIRHLEPANGRFYFCLTEFALRPKILENLDKNWNTVAPYLLSYNASVPPSLKDQISEIIKQEYFGEDHVSLETFPALTQVMTDHNYRVYIEQAARLQAAASSSPVWVYFYSYRANNSYSDYLSRSKQDFGKFYLMPSMFDVVLISVAL